jgi:hypothetical protein
MGSVRIFLYSVVELSTILGDALACKSNNNGRIPSDDRESKQEAQFHEQ